MRNPFTEHPHSIGESYFSHFSFAFGLSIEIFTCAISALLHAIFPFLHKESTSKKLRILHYKTKNRTP